MQHIHRPRSVGFTLVELLVVIGIIALLLGLLLPVLGYARAVSRRTVCASNQRQVAMAATLRLQDTEGYLPLAGLITVPPWISGPASLPLALSDRKRVRYDYDRSFGANPTQESLLPIPLAILRHLDGSVEDLEALRRDGDPIARQLALRAFTCPSAMVVENKLPTPTNGIAVDMPYFRLDQVRSDFAFNESMMGFHYGRDYGRNRLRGNVSAVSNPAQTVLLGDASNTGAPTMTWGSALDADAEHVSLADVLDQTPQANQSVAFSEHRHDRQMNVAFVDGHVESVRITPEALRSILLRTD